MKYTYLILLLIFSSCGGDTSNTFTHELKYSGTYTIYLDSTTSYASLRLQYSKKNEQILWALNTYTNTLYAYNLNSQYSQSQIKYEISGVDGVGRLEGFHIHNSDSIFLYSFKSRLLSLADTAGRIKDRRRILKEGKDYMVPSVDNGMPMSYYNGNMYFNCWGSNKEYYRNKKYPETLIGVYNLRDSSMIYHMPYPQIYTTGIWGIQAYPMYNVLWKESNIICSFPIDGSIFLFDTNTNQIKEVKGKSVKHKEVHPLSKKDLKIQSANVLEESNHYLMQNTYAYLFTNNQYLVRVYLNAMSENQIDDLSRRKLVLQTASLIIYDDNLKIIAEVNIPDRDYLFHLCFFANDDFYIPRIDRNSEDILIFDKFNILKK